MKWLILYFISFLSTCDCIDDTIFEFGKDEGEEVSKIDGSIEPTVDGRRTVVHYALPPCTKMSYIHVVVHNPKWRPSVSVNAIKQEVVIFYRYNHNSESTYEVIVKAITDSNCTSSSSNIVDNPEDGRETNSKQDYGDYDNQKTEVNVTESPEEGVQDTNEEENAEGHVAGLTAPPLRSSFMLRRDAEDRDPNCDYCCPGRGCPKVFNKPPDPRDFEPIDDESIYGQKNVDRSDDKSVREEVGKELEMHPLKERACDELLEHPLLRTPPPEPERPRPPWVRKPRVFKVMARFPLLDKEFYARWVNHQKELQMMRAKVDARPPALFPELYLKPRRLDFYSRKLEENMAVNKELLKKINLIQRTGGMVKCWREESNGIQYDKLLRRYRQRQLDEIHRMNIYIYMRMVNAKSEQPTTKELNEMWKDTKNKLILGSAQPFILFKTGSIDRDIKDPAFDKPFSLYRPRVYMTFWVTGGSKIGQVIIELFNDIVPRTCQLFMSLVRGDSHGHAYTGTRLFRIVPNLFCRGGDVTKDNGFGCYLPENTIEPMGPENFTLKHSVPGTLSMVVTSGNELCGQFNIIFKPLPQFDEKHVVFGRIIAGPFLTLERISAIGLPLGSTAFDLQIRYCGWLSRSGVMHEGAPNTIKFRGDRKKK